MKDFINKNLLFCTKNINDFNFVTEFPNCVQIKIYEIVGKNDFACGELIDFEFRVTLHNNNKLLCKLLEEIIMDITYDKVVSTDFMEKFMEDYINSKLQKMPIPIIYNIKDVNTRIDNYFCEIKDTKEFLSILCS